MSRELLRFGKRYLPEFPRPALPIKFCRIELILGSPKRTDRVLLGVRRATFKVHFGPPQSTDRLLDYRWLVQSKREGQLRGRIQPSQGSCQWKSTTMWYFFVWLKGRGAECRLHPLIHTCAPSESSTKYCSWVSKEKVWIKVWYVTSRGARRIADKFS